MCSSVVWTLLTSRTSSFVYAPRFDCGCQYEICVELLDQRKKPICTFQPEKVFFEQWNDEPWCQMTHVFKDYGPGVRFIRFTHGGVDTQFWSGWFGIRVTNSSVEILHLSV
uniref:FBA domain-containing protein n=1 Tax=Cyprinus carpio TaxID=7962 RepID=A0A8C1YJX1_CYPCA